MKKRDLKKLALLGLASGCLLSAPVAANEASSLNLGIQLAKSCGAGCGGKAPAQGASRAQTADNSDYRPSEHGPLGSCSSARPVQGSCSSARPAQGSCSSARPAQGSCSSARPQASCNSARPAQAGCGGKVAAGCGGQQNRPSQWQQNDNNYTAENDDYQQPNDDTRRPSTQSNSSKGYSAQSGCGGHNKQNQNYTAFNDVDAKPTAQQEQALTNQLSSSGKSQFESMDAEGKALAIKLANQSCKGQNDCKGLNSCKSDKNSCAGQGGCKGTSPGPFKDKNDAVKVAAQKLASKRSAAY